MAFFQTRSEEENEQVHPDVEEDEQQFQRGKLDGFVFVAQTGKQDGLKGIQSHDDGHDFDELGMVGVVQDDKQ